MKNILYILSLFLVVGLVSCDDFLDVNDDPNRVTAVTLAAQLPPIIEGTSRAHYSIENSIGLVTQQLGSYFGYPDQLSADGTWSTIYLRNLNNARQIVAAAEESNSPHYAGVARVIMALNLGLATDTWEDIPYTQAFDGSSNLTPSYDAQQSIYAEITNLLDQAISNLGAAESIFAPSADDLAYGGSVDKWMKLAYALKARYQLHLINKNGAGSILSDVDNSFVSSSEDFQISYNEAANLNPWHSNVALANNTGNLSVSFGSYFVDHVNGTFIDAEDPRRFVLFDTSGITDLIGIKGYDENAPTNTVDFEETTWYSRASSPIPMVTHAEVKFIEAEAALASNADRAYNAYLAGIESHMTAIGVAAIDIQNYLADSDVGVGSGNLSIQNILQQKYIAMFLNPEVWVDMRRVGYASYPGFEIPDPTMFNGPAQRAMYPLDELNRNGEAVRAAQKAFDVQMWRDQ